MLMSSIANLTARQRLLAEHERIRNLLAEAEQFADLRTPGAFGAAVATLYRALAEHNAAEELMLLPLLRDVDLFSEKRIERMSEEHAAEHAALRAVLASGGEAELAAALSELAEELRAHLDAEERTFLHPHVLDLRR